MPLPTTPPTSGSSPSGGEPDDTTDLATLIEGIKAAVSAPTSTWEKWQQIPAWVVGAAALIGGGDMIVQPSHSSSQGWTGVIVALFIALLLSYRSAFTLGGDGGGSDPGIGSAGGGGGTGPNPASTLGNPPPTAPPT